mmetsp:Transcript_60758/g.131760  ORF Transcript_60758/g.131760 Transcript_60758/m.131760 type:complete len:211 (-) Transcript_60758:1947-2579(-)
MTRRSRAEAGPEQGWPPASLQSVVLLAGRSQSEECEELAESSGTWRVTRTRCSAAILNRLAVYPARARSPVRCSTAPCSAQDRGLRPGPAADCSVQGSRSRSPSQTMFPRGLSTPCRFHTGLGSSSRQRTKTTPEEELADTLEAGACRRRTTRHYTVSLQALPSTPAGAPCGQGTRGPIRHAASPAAESTTPAALVERTAGWQGLPSACS